MSASFPQAEIMGQPFFSIVIPTYNCLRDLEPTIASVRQQNFVDYECLLMDGASTDGTREYSANLSKNDSRVQSHSAPDHGIYDAMNKGIRLSRGKYLYFLGAGDCLADNILESVADYLSNQPQNLPILLYGNVFWVSKSQIYNGIFSRYKLSMANLCHQSVFYDRRIFDLNGEFQTAFSLYADWEFNIKCFGNRSISKIYFDSIIANFDGNGLSSKNSDRQFERNQPFLVFKHLGFLPFIYFILRKTYNAIFFFGNLARKRFA